MDVAEVTSSLGFLRSRVAARAARARVALPLICCGSLACGSPPAEQPAPLEGTDLVSGTSLARYGLLVIPPRGGVAEFRSVANPSTVRWTGRLDLGRVSAAYALGSSAVLRDGTQLRRYATSPTETVTPLPDAPRDARWIPSTTGGAFVAGDRILAVTATTAAEITAAGEVLWAAPAVGGRIVALVEAPDGPRLDVWAQGESLPAETRTVGVRHPVVLTGWGRQVVTASEDGDGVLAWSIPGLERGEPLAVGGRPEVLATSPSQHRVFAASSGRGRFVSIDRYEWRETESSRVEAPLSALRPGITGGRVVAFDGARAWSVRVGEAGLDPLPGEWRPDLPLALPGGGVLVSTGEGLGFLPPLAAAPEPVDGPADAWWLPFRWGPRLPVTSVAVAADEALQDEESALEAMSDSVAAPGGVGLLTMGTPPGGRPAPGEDAEPLPGDAPAPVPMPPPASAPADLPPGFYAVAISSRQLGSVERIRRLLNGAGYSTRLRGRLDEASDMWYRLLVGPYASRPEAERVARELRRERGIDAWIHEEFDEETERRRS